MKSIGSLVIILILFLGQNTVLAQEPVKPRPSPLAIVTMKHKSTYVKVTYSQPHKNGRKIFDGLVPFGEVWRTGANEATEITLTDMVQIADDTLFAGTYSIFTIPKENTWTIIFNKELGQWGAYNYLQTSDALRVEVPVQNIESPIWEPFTISFEQHNAYTDLVMKWAKTQVKVPIVFLD